MKATLIQRAMRLCKELAPLSIAIDAIRYEALRTLTPQKYREVCNRNLNGENFDAMVDSIIADNVKDVQETCGNVENTVG